MTFHPLYMDALVTALMAAFMPGASPPEVSTPTVEIFFAISQLINLSNIQIINESEQRQNRKTHKIRSRSENRRQGNAISTPLPAYNRLSPTDISRTGYETDTNFLNLYPLTDCNVKIR